MIFLGGMKTSTNKIYRKHIIRLTIFYFNILRYFSYSPYFVQVGCLRSRLDTRVNIAENEKCRAVDENVKCLG